MRTRTVTVHEGELLGPVDWSFDFAAEGWDRNGSTNPECIERGVDMLRRLEAGLARGETWEATRDGGWPRVGWGEVVAVGMYDGWPFWRPMPSIRIAGPLGGEWAWFGAVTGVRRKGESEGQS